MLFLISSMVLGLVNQLLIFSQLCLIELLGLLTGLGLLDGQADVVFLQAVVGFIGMLIQ